MKRTWFWLPVLAVPLLLAACGGLVNPARDSGSAEAETTSRPESTLKSGEVSPDNPSRIAFDIDGIHDPLVNEEIKASLRDALEGIVNEDLEQFNRAFASIRLAKANEFAFTPGSITFTGVDEISEQSSSRVVINVHDVRTTADGEVKHSWNYWFMPDKDGNWKLVTID
jgi:hypothetical protein